MDNKTVMKRIERQIANGYKRPVPRWVIQRDGPLVGNVPYEAQDYSDEWYEAQEEARQWLLTHG